MQAPTAILRFALPDVPLWQRLLGKGFGRFQPGDLLGLLPEGSDAPRLYSLASGSRADPRQQVQIADGLVGIDGEMRALGLGPDGAPWAVAVEAPDPRRRAPLAMLALQDAAVATSGDYRHRVKVGDRHLSHTMDPRLGAPLPAGPASVTVVAPTCAEADAWATAMMVLGPGSGATLARELGLQVLFLLRGPDGAIRQVGVGALFGAAAANRFASA